MSRQPDLASLLAEIRACRVCAGALGYEPHPIVQAGRGARVLIVGQAPGSKVHASGIPWDDDSGDRLRDWLGLDRGSFYDPEKVALAPMGFCYPGKGRSGDLPPRPECAPLWHRRLLAQLPEIRLTLLVGQYAQKHYLADRRGKTMTETVQRFRDYLPEARFPLPHPSWRNIGWQKKQPWFAAETLPALRQAVALALG